MNTYRMCSSCWSSSYCCRAEYLVLRLM